jgi:pimeloyl-ACP methyl ester carboxylesterase
MLTTAALLVGLLGAAPPGPDEVRTVLARVAPSPSAAGKAGRSPGQDRAVILINGLWLRPLSKEKINHAALRPWQQSTSAVVRRLAQDSDVWAVGYGQNAAVQTVTAAVAAEVKKVKALGYKEVVLVGHSAGALIARQFVEDEPRAGVTKVVQVCAPNLGSSWAALQAVRSAKVAFLASLTRSARRKLLEERADKLIPTAIEFACVVGTARLRKGDGLVATRSQWSDDLQKQGIPAYALVVTHWDAMKNGQVIDAIARLVKDPQPRWDANRVAVARKKLLGS